MEKLPEKLQKCDERKPRILLTLISRLDDNDDDDITALKT